MSDTIKNQRQSLSFAPKKWDSGFFGRKIQKLSLYGPVAHDELEIVLSEIDQQGVWGIEVEVKPERMSDVPALEDAGFRMVDSRMSFVSRMTIRDVDDKSVPFGRLRQVELADLPRISKLTTKYLVDNPAFYSRFKNPRLFTRAESIRYYDAWNRRAFAEQPGLFVVWEVDGEVGAYFNYMRVDHPERNPMFKGILTAVAPKYRGQSAQNTMQSFLFRHFGESEWWIDNTTQISNIAVIRNHIRAKKVFHSSSLIFFRVGQVAG